MINIVVDSDKGEVEIEDTVFTIHSIGSGVLELQEFIKFILDKAYYSGEALCLEAKSNGVYVELDRWKEKRI